MIHDCMRIIQLSQSDYDIRGICSYTHIARKIWEIKID